MLVADESRSVLATLHDPSSLGQKANGGLLREENHAFTIEVLMAAFHLTPCEAEVLYWVTKGKINKDIGEILGTSPRTVNKHPEHVFEKLGVETRTVAANLVMSKVAGVRPGEVKRAGGTRQRRLACVCRCSCYGRPKVLAN